VAALDIVHNGVELGPLAAGLLAVAALAVAVGVWWSRAWRARQVARLAARYQPLIDELLMPAGAGVAMAELLRAPASHRFVIGTLLLGLLRVTSGEAIEYARALTVSLGLRDAWRRELSSRWARRRANAAHALGILHDPTTADALTGMLNDSSASVRAAAVGALGAIGDPKALPALLAALDDTTRFACGTVVEALGGLGEAAAPALLDHAQKRPAQAAVLIEVAGSIGGAAIAGQLLPWVSDPRPEVRAAAIGALGVAGLDERTYYYALKALEDGSGTVRAAAARAVGRAGREDAVPYLRAHLADEPAVAAECAAALRQLGRSPS
jgi:HEAT repeat protein